jgi:hypothetical protein
VSSPRLHVSRSGLPLDGASITVPGQKEFAQAFGGPFDAKRGRGNTAGHEMKVAAANPMSACFE